MSWQNWATSSESLFWDAVKRRTGLTKKTTKIEVVLPFGVSQWKFYDGFREDAIKNLTELATLSGKLFFNISGFEASIEIAVSENASLHQGFKRYWAQQHKGLAWDYWFIKLSSIVEVDISREARSSGVYSGNKLIRKEVLPISVLLDVATSVFEHNIQDFLLCMTIAAPGTVNTVRGTLWLNGKFHRIIDGFYSDLDNDVLYVREEIGWPISKSLPVEKVWDWFHSFKGIERGVGRGSIGRAVAAMSYLVRSDFREKSDFEIMWALLGLEAIYCHPNSGTMNQLIEKSQILLGPIDRNKNAIREMYNLRSRILHGDLDLPFKYSCWDGEPTASAYWDKQDKADSIAKIMLVSTLQILVERDIIDINFKYILDMPPK